ncbi:MAG: hypothetical protein CMI02_10665 [Oceanospirillaceae bacterium]|nr:hypothetical protein [Oceanospirillaceae bacterium]MBT12483.1 hypothetical protein [Oceanospirillaceae bacterium]|tara:strand:+ start:273876 stop:275096 length:1221 start_codon:yes stop_codon:yes gene_type:complete
METVNIQWQSLSGQWMVSDLSAAEWQPLAVWADDQPDLTQVRMVLSPVNYATHWLSMPGVSGRQIAKALPFALEESLIEDIAHYLIVHAGQSGKKVRAYVINSDLIARLLEECELHNLVLRELIPQTQLMAPGNQILHSRQNGEAGWLLNLPGMFEGWVPEAGMPAILDALFESEEEERLLESLTVVAPQLDQANLLKTTLETSYPGVIGEINTHPGTGQQDADEALAGKPVSFLTGQFQVKEAEENRPAVWWRPLAAMAAVWLVAVTLWLVIDQQTTRSQADQVRTETVNLYKKLFPGERIRLLERQIREKISGDTPDTGAGFLGSTNMLARVYASQNLQDAVEMTSVRYSDRLGELVVEVRAKSLNELQTLRQALENQGLTAEVASATNDKDGVKGRIRIGGAA